MVLMAIIGSLGAGKTLALTYLGVRNALQGRRIYSNYHLGYEYTYIKTPDEIDSIKKGVFLGDELWAWLDSRTSQKKKNRFISKILLKSRKRGYQIIYTLQNFSQIDKRIRKITDFITKPQLYPNNKKCVMPIYDLKTMQPVKTLKFIPSEYYDLFDTNEEIDDDIEE